MNTSIMHAKATLLGLVCGDAVGATLEFREKGSFKPIKDMQGGGKFHLKAGEWTDDTAMTLCLAESLITKGFDPYDQMTQYWRWADQGHYSCRPHPIGMGKQISKALIKFKQTGNPNAGQTDSRHSGNGSLMRTAPIPIFTQSEPLETCLDLTKAMSVTTHASDKCIIGCQV